MAISASATQDFVPIKEVRDGIVILKDGSMRALLLASSINLSLKSFDEQNATLMQFQTFLNSLDFSVQIVVESRRLDIRPYLVLLDGRMKEQVEPLLKVQTKEYMQFIRDFTDQVAIMTKSFIIVVPYSAAPLSTKGSITKSLFGNGSKKPADIKKEGIYEFEEKRTQLEQRIGVVQQGLSRVGVRTVQLGTEEAIELFYKIFNPGETTGSIKVPTQ
jgi:hypothetical protein